MCVLIVKPKGVKMPSRDTLQLCFLANRDGCGFVSTKREYHSMNFEPFYRELQKVGDEELCMIHFRWATHGSVCLRNTHPFKDGDIYFAHNGVLSICPDGDTTDSETAFRRYIMPAIRKHGFDSRQMINVCQNIIGGSKFAIFDRVSNHIRTIGSFTEFEGSMFSNMRWQIFDFGYRSVI